MSIFFAVALRLMPECSLFNNEMAPVLLLNGEHLIIDCISSRSRLFQVPFSVISGFFLSCFRFLSQLFQVSFSVVSGFFLCCFWFLSQLFQVSFSVVLGFFMCYF